MVESLPGLTMLLDFNLFKDFFKLFQALETCEKLLSCLQDFPGNT